jgi:FAD/FMN-containing dehydrogenase
VTLGVTDDLLASFVGFSGTLLLPGDRGYEHARGVFNAAVDKRPALIARCRGVADVAAAVRFARDNALELSVRGGGHHVAGTAVTDGGVMIDLSQMRGIHVDPIARTARVHGGVTWRELDRETQLYGLATPGGTVSSTGVGGLILGGGLGWLSGKHGLSADNLVSVEMVTADGRTLRASEGEHEDLFWALRGGGGNFGVVTTFELRLHPVGPLVNGGMVVHSLQRAPRVLRAYRELTEGALDELTVDAALHVAPGGERRIALAVCHAGPIEQAARDLRPLLDLGTPLEPGPGPVSYTALNSMLDGAYPPGRLHFWRSAFLSELSDDVIGTLVEQFQRCPSPLGALVVRRFGGAVARIPVSATAFPHRQPGYYLVVEASSSDPAAAEANIAWAHETFTALEPSRAMSRWASFLGEEEGGEDAALLAYGPNLERLALVKAAYDPANVFHLNVNVNPVAAGGAPFRADVEREERFSS